MRPDDVLDFWLGPPATDAGAFSRKLHRWFDGGPTVDSEVRARFAALNAQALAGGLAGWAASPRGRLALIIVLDQFTRNLFRDSPGAWAADPEALTLALAGLGRGEDAALSFEEAMFFYLPLGHAEDLALQQRHLALVEQKAAGAPPALAAAWGSVVTHARSYVEIIARFGRFPHRNRVLGRASTPEELTFLATPSTNG